MTETSEISPDAPRFAEGDQDTVIDTKRRLIWMKQDSYQLTGKWLNWLECKGFAEEMNKKLVGGFSDWRMPTQEEAKSLFNKAETNKDHMGQIAFCSPLFSPGFCFLCWTSDVRNKIQAIRFGYRKGGSMYDDIYRPSRGATRLVRSMEKKRRA